MKKYLKLLTIFAGLLYSTESFSAAAEEWDRDGFSAMRVVNGDSEISRNEEGLLLLGITIENPADWITLRNVLGASNEVFYSAAFVLLGITSSIIVGDELTEAARLRFESFEGPQEEILKTLPNFTSDAG